MIGIHCMRNDDNTQILLQGWLGGAASARDHLIARMLPELQAIAAARLRHEAASSLSTQDLIHDAVERLIKIDSPSIGSRAHFLALASRLMRNILVDHARSRDTEKRRHQKVELNTRIDGAQSFDLALLDSALIRLGAVEPRYMELVEMRYFGGMSITDIAEVTGWSEPTVKRRWQAARAWLADALAHPIDAHD